MKIKHMKKFAFVLAMLIAVNTTVTMPALADQGSTSGGTSGILNITYDLYISGVDAYAVTIPGTDNPDPGISTYVEARYYHPDSQSTRLETASGEFSARAIPPYEVIEARSVHTANSSAWGYFRATLIKP